MRFASKPQYGRAKLDRSRFNTMMYFPLSEGGGVVHDLASNMILSRIGNAAWTPGGISGPAQGDYLESTTTFDGTNIVPPITYVWSGIQTTATDLYSCALSISNTSTFNDTGIFGNSGSVGSVWQFPIGGQYNSSFFSIPPNVPLLIATSFTITTVTTTAYWAPVTGFLAGFATYTTPTQNNSGNVGTPALVRVGRNGYSSAHTWTGKHYWAAIIRGALSVADVASLWVDPYQLLKPSAQRPLYIPGLIVPSPTHFLMTMGVGN